MLGSTPLQRLSNGRYLVSGLALCLLIATCTVGGYQRLFSSFALYDDEGYVMLSLQQYMQGRLLYDDVYSQYGPAFYAMSDLLHRATGWPITHDITRFKTLAVWLATSLLAAGWLYRATRSKGIASAGLLLVFLHLDRLAMEPGHPQEVCLVAVVFCAFLGSFVRGTRHELWLVAAMGAAAAAATMTKINVGVLLLLSLSAAFLLLSREHRFRRALLLVVVFAAVALPLAVGRHVLLDSHGYRLPLVLSVAIALTAWVTCKVDPQPFVTLRHTAVLWSAFAVTLLLIAIIPVARGTSLPGLADGLLLQHLSFVDMHYHDPPINLFAPLVVVAAMVVARSSLRDDRGHHIVWAALTVLAFTAGLRHIVETFQPLTHGAQDRGYAGTIVSLSIPFAWIILLPLRDPGLSDESRFARLSLCFIALLQPLIAHPVPGTQMAIGSLPIVLVMLTAVHDAFEWLRRHVPRALLAERLTIGLVGLLALTMVGRTIHLWHVRSELTPLGLPGATRLRLIQQLVERERWTVEQLQQRADTFLCLRSGHNSLFLWTDMEPPTGMNTTVWQDLLRDDQQQTIIDAISRRDRVYVVVEKSEPESLRKHGPLLDYVRANFEPVADHGTTEIWGRASSD